MKLAILIVLLTTPLIADTVCYDTATLNIVQLGSAGADKLDKTTVNCVELENIKIARADRQDLTYDTASKTVKLKPAATLTAEKEKKEEMRDAMLLVNLQARKNIIVSITSTTANVKLKNALNSMLQKIDDKINEILLKYL